jgi:hypothetical protein
MPLKPLTAGLVVAALLSGCGSNGRTTASEPEQELTLDGQIVPTKTNAGRRRVWL